MSGGPAPRARPPGVERLLAATRPRLGPREHAATLAAARAVIAEERGRLDSGHSAMPLPALAAALVARLDGSAGAGLVPAINATGVILHTNLGRAPWPEAAIRAATEAAAGASLLEMDRASGRRGARFRTVEEQLIALTGAEDALVTNNNAAAVALAVGLAGRGRGVAIARGELVEIGGGVRIPEIIRRAGLRLVEVGTTNRTRLEDYEEVLAAGGAALVLRVHASNFRMVGFVESPDPEALAALAHRHGVALVDDLGSGALLDTAAFGLAHEPTPAERLAAGADLVTFSGDKLVGGPQAGLIAGRADLIERLRRDPLARAMRPDKVTLAALAATLGLYRAGRALAEIPVWQIISAGATTLETRARALAAALPGAVAVPLEATIGGGSLPGQVLPSWGLALEGGSAARLLLRLRRGRPAVIGRIDDGVVLLDLRTVAPTDDDRLAAAVVAAISGAP